MNILFFAHSDPYGILNMASKAINRFSKHESRVVTITETQNFDSDVSLYRDMWGGFTTQPPGHWGGIFNNLLNWSDVVVLGFGMAGKDDKGNPVNDADIAMDNISMLSLLKSQNKKVIGLLSGSIIARTKYNFYVKICKDNGWPLCTYQPELSLLVKDKYDCQYLPIILDTNHPRYRNSVFDFIEPESFTIDRVAICHSWLGRGSVESDSALDIINNCNKDEIKFNPLIIQNCSFYDLLMMKKSCHIGLDFELDRYEYCGINSFENSLIGLVNITSTSGLSLKLIEDITGALPWFIVRDKEELHNTLENLYNDKDKLYERMLNNRNFGLTNMSDEKLIPYWIKYFEVIYGI